MLDVYPDTVFGYTYFLTRGREQKLPAIELDENSAYGRCYTISTTGQPKGILSVIAS
jgi:hypothetical protein